MDVDYFLVPLCLQLLEWCDMLDDAEAVLVEYQQVNPNNPNAHKYLINHYKKHGNTHQIIPVLQVISAHLNITMMVCPYIYMSSLSSDR